MPQIMVDDQTAEKLKTLASLSHLSMSEIVRDYVEKVSTLIPENAQRISLGCFSDLDKKRVIALIAEIEIGSHTDTEPQDPILRGILERSRTKGE